MSKAAHIRKVRVRDTAAKGYPVEDDYLEDDYLEDDRYAEDGYVEEDEEAYVTGEVEQAPGLFSSPGRVVALGGAVLSLVLVMSVVVFLLGSQSTPAPPSGVGTGIGQQAPSFSLVDVRTNQQVSLASLRGKPVFINFWGTWCPPCRYEMPAMQQFYDKHRGQVEVVGISMAPRDSTEMVKNFVDQERYTWTFIHDGDQQTQLNYQAFQIPTSYFLDENGMIRAVHIGPMDVAQMENYLQKAQAAR